MENLIISLNTVLPLFFCIALGYFLRLIHMLDEHSLNKINKLCFKVFLPVYLFNNMYTTNLAAAFNGRLILFAICALMVLYVVLLLVIPRLEQDNARRGAMIQGIFRSNFALLGLPIATSLCGEANVGPTALLIGLFVPIYNVLAVITLEAYRGSNTGAERTSLKKVAKGVVTNPLIIASVLGALCNMINLEFPYAVNKTIVDLSRVATPLSLVTLGGFFTFGKIKVYRKHLAIVVIGKLVLSTLVMVGLAVLLGFRNETLVPIMIMFGAPTAVSSFSMAQQMDSDGELAAEIVVFTSAISIVTIFCWIFVLKQLGVI